MVLPTLPLLLLLLIIMAVVTQYTGAQTPLPPQNNVNNYNYNIDNYNDDDGAPYRDNFNAATAILVVVLVSAFFFLAFLSLYFRRCSRDRSAIAATVAAGAVTTSRRGARREEGLNPAILETFPTLAYSDVTQLKVGKESLECAVCLSEFTNDETLRMLPRCCHVFHPECIDTWLQTHVTCPVCRDNLAVVPTEEEEAGYQVPRLGGERETEESSSDQRAVIVDIARMGRSHSTGHVSGGGADRFTLRLPEHVRQEIVGDGMMLRRSASVAVVSAVGRRNMEGEDGGGSWRRRGLIRAGLSGRWTSGILSRVTSTWRKREEGSGSGSGSGSVKRVEMKSEGSLKAAGMFDCLGGGTRSDSRDDEPISRNVNESKDDTTSVLDRV